MDRKTLNQFFDEYEALCRKYGIMLLSDGEEVWADKMCEGFWQVRETTFEKIEDGRTDIELD